jgi:hypothetical protein
MYACKTVACTLQVYLDDTGEGIPQNNRSHAIPSGQFSISGIYVGILLIAAPHFYLPFSRCWKLRGAPLRKDDRSM